MASQRIYSWQALDDNQYLQQGEIAADSLKKVRYQLIAQGLLPGRIKAGPRLATGCWRLTSLVIITRQLATMLQAGLPLLNSLQLLAKGHPKPQWRYILQQIQREVAQGKPFSQVLAGYPQVFSPIFCELIRTGELTGELELCCLKLAEQQERTVMLQARIKKALRYPLFILGVTVIVALLMLTLVLPEFEAIYHSFDAPLPYFTQFFITLSKRIRDYGALGLLLIMLTSLIYLHYFHRQADWQRREQRLILTLPLIKQLLHTSYLARIFHTLAMTQRAGIILSDSLTAAANSANHFLYQQAVMAVKLNIEQGRSFYQAATECRLFSELSCQLIQVGEESGALDEMLERLATIYQQQVESLAEGFSQTLEPILMLLLAGIVGSLIIAMYLPIFQLGNVIG